jgi:integrase
VTKAGHKSFVFQYRDRVTRKQFRMTFAFDLGLKRAKHLAENARLRVRLGGNPLTESRKAAALAENTLQSISQEYLKRRAGELRSKKQIQSALERLVYPKLGSRQIAEIRRSEISRLLEDIADEQGPVAADYVLSVVRRIMNWHASRSDDFRSPIVPGMAQTKPAERTRERILTDDELRAIWKAAEEGSGPFGALLRFILLTACRRTEAAAMTHSEVVGSDWTIPAARYKTKRKITLPLSKAAQELLASIPRVKGVDFVFTGGRVRLSGFGARKASFDEACGVTGWVIHDLRHTARSLMARAGVPSDHAERCLGHMITGVEGTYDRHDYLEHMRRAFEMLAAQIDRIINPQDNVVPMRSKEVPA